MADSEGYLAWADVIRELRITISEDEAAAIYGQGGDGTADAWADEPFETILNEWLEVLSHRAKACGPDGAYPFEVEAGGLQRRARQSPVYLFQLLVSLGSTVSHQDGTTASKIFEELSAAAAGQYLGDSKAAVVFGWPRQELRPGFREAVAELVDLLSEENVACADREGMSDSKDDGLDVVAWRSFPDRKPSKLILFGQCATGQHWKKKTHELRPSDWCKRNFLGTLALEPVPAFFVPMALSERDANDAGVNQLLLDRCRISALCGGGLGDGLDERLWQWIDASLEEGITLDAD